MKSHERTILRVAVTLLIPGLLTGCGLGAGSDDGGILNHLAGMPDANKNGYPEIPAPDGVDETATVAIRIQNHITRSEAEDLAEVSVPQIVEDNVRIRARIRVDLTYPSGITDQLTGTRPIAPFEVQAEAVCPQVVEAWVTVVAEGPLVGSQTITGLGPYRVERAEGGFGYACETLINIESFVDEYGGATATIDVQPFPESAD
jgi:hypothetical protein